ncbi:MAG: hypothetical protein ACOC28_02665 [Alkalispirochaetaceae bacterium]
MPILLFSCLVLPLGAQDALPPDAEPIPPEELQEELDHLFDRALKLEISARITTLDGEEVFWNMDLTRITLAGRAVQVRLDGSNITVLADFTPYVQDDGSLVLVAEGRTWLSGEDEAVSYRTSFKSLPIRLGEPVLFFPLGNRPVTAVGEEGGEQFNIELEINVVSYGEHG